MLKRALTCLLIAFLAFSLFSDVIAQTPQPDVRINTISTIELPDSVNLKVYFNLFDKQSGQAITDLTPQSAQIALLQDSFLVGKLNSQIYPSTSPWCWTPVVVWLAPSNF